MIDNLISNPMIQVWINLELSTLKDIKFLIFRDFFGFFFNFSEFKINLFKLK